MSLALKKLNTIKVQNEVTAVNEKNYYGVFTGGDRAIWRAYPSTSSSNNTNFIFSFRPPMNTIVNRHMKLRVQVSITFNGDSSGNLLLNSGYDALRSFPLTSIIAITIHT